MIMAYAVIFLVILAALFRRDLSAIGRLPFRGGWKLMALVSGLFLLQAGIVLYASGQSTLQMLVLMLTQSALILFLFWNRHIPGTKLFALGLLLNVTVMAANGGWMPITPETQQFIHPNQPAALYTRPPRSKNIVLPQSETRLWYLSDVVRLTLPRQRSAISVGDILLIVGVAQLIFQSTTAAGTRQSAGKSVNAHSSQQ